MNQWRLKIQSYYKTTVVLQQKKEKQTKTGCCSLPCTTESSEIKNNSFFFTFAAGSKFALDVETSSVNKPVHISLNVSVATVGNACLETWTGGKGYHGSKFGSFNLFNSAWSMCFSAYRSFCGEG